MATMDHRVKSVEACIGLLTSIAERQQGQIEQAQRDSIIPFNCAIWRI